MRKQRTARQEKVLDDLKKVFPVPILCNYEDLARLRHPEIWKISNESRFYNKLAENILHSWDDINNIFHLLPESTKKKIIASKEFDTLFTTQILSHLEQELKKKERQKKLKESEEDIFLLYKLYSTFLRIGLNGVVNLMPVEFGHILRTQIKPTFDLMNSITSYSERIAPKKANLAKFPFTKKDFGL